MAIVAVIFAGGASLRMGQDKAAMYGGVERLKECLYGAGVERCVVLCGSETRRSLFEGEVLVDPPEMKSLHQLIPWIHRRLAAPVLLVPCDAFLLSSEAIAAFLGSAPGGGVPCDENGRRQPLFAYLPQDITLNEFAESVSDLLQDLPSVDVRGQGAAFSNFNRPTELQHPELSNRRL